MDGSHYDVLGVPGDATAEDIRKAYRRLAKKYHPDSSDLPAGEAEEMFRKVGEAYDVLSDPERRAEYDDSLDCAVHVSVSRNRGPRVGEDLRYDMQAGLRDVFEGRTVRVSLMRGFDCESCGGTGARDGKVVRCRKCGGSGYVEQVIETSHGYARSMGGCGYCGGTGSAAEAECPSCHGKGRKGRPTDIDVEIPRGMQDGGRLRVPGCGNGGYRGGRDGDLYAVIHVIDEDGFERYDDDLGIRLDVSYSKLVLGGTVTVRGIDGKQIRVRIPKGTQADTLLRVSGQGMPVIGRDGLRGDLLVRIGVVIPHDISAEERELISRLGDAGSAGHRGK